MGPKQLLIPLTMLLCSSAIDRSANAQATDTSDGATSGERSRDQAQHEPADAGPPSETVDATQSEISPQEPVDGGSQPGATLAQPPPVPTAPPSPSIAAAASAPPGAARGAGHTNDTLLVVGTRPISAASSFSVRDRDFGLRPIGSVQDILRVTPGLVLVQHSGGGKANQYLLRGFDGD